MTNLTRDPKGYYIALGIAEDADGDAIKSAYRQKAKRLHPDFNPSPVAAKQFHRLHEAYDTLSDPEKRAAYDRPWKTAQKHERQEKPRSQPRPEARREAPPPPETPKPAAARTRTSLDEPALCQCGKITAQPRYVVFDLVWGRLKKVQKRTVAAIYCRSCADRAAVKASLITWLAGWWAWPSGPKETVKALINNIRGGRKPADRNARLLLRQARAFRARGELDLARSAAGQALMFAKATTLRGDVEQLLTALGGASRSIKDRWAKPGWAPMAQVLPLAIIVGGLSTLAAYSTPAPLTQMAAQSFERVRAILEPAPSATTTADVVGRVYSVTKEGGAVRTGPGASYQMEAILKSGTLVLATETSPDGEWLRIVTSDGTAGFVALADVTAEVPADALTDIGAFGPPAKAN
ncbi:MAG: DnaJ domain-containing protein [Rhodospirillaceae bacterium]